MMFGPLLRANRESAGRTLRDVASALGFSVPYLSDIERERRAPLVDVDILRAAAFLDLDDTRTSALLLEAARARGAFHLASHDVSDRHREVGALLARHWHALTDEQLDAIRKVVIE